MANTVKQMKLLKQKKPLQHPHGLKKSPCRRRPFFQAENTLENGLKMFLQFSVNAFAIDFCNGGGNAALHEGRSSK